MDLIVDAREFREKRMTGIGRVLLGLISAMVEKKIFNRVLLTVTDRRFIPFRLTESDVIVSEYVPKSFLRAEKFLTNMTKNSNRIYLSPYPKLPLFGCHCPAVHIIHDVLDLTHDHYRKRTKAIFDKIRLKMALKRADLTWYDSLWSMEETEKLTGFTGKKPRVRYLAISEKFNPENETDKEAVLYQYGLQPGYILILGNGLPHKNLEVVLRISKEMKRKLVFVGVTSKNQAYWKIRCPDADAVWIEYVEEEQLTRIIKSAFCLAQPSTDEGYGYPPLEAMACGIPTVVSKIPILIETTGGNSFQANPSDPKQWLEAFAALEDLETHTEYSEKGLKWVEAFRGRKGWRHHVNDIAELLGENKMKKALITGITSQDSSYLSKKAP